MTTFSIPFTPGEVCYASGLSPQGTRTKRYKGSAIDEELPVQPDGFVECEMRAAGPYLPELPWETSELRFGHPLHEASVPLAVRKICTDEGLAVQDIDICDCSDLYSRDETKTTVVRIIADGKSSQQNWINVARTVHRHLVNHGITDTGVEVYAKALEEGPNVFSVFEGDEIQQELGLEGVVTIGCFRIGADNAADDCLPTIQIGVEPTAQRDWKTLRDQILAILDRHKLSMVGVLIKKERLWGSISRSHNRYVESDEDLISVEHVGDRDNSDLAARWTYDPGLIILEEEDPGEAEVEA